MISCRWPEPSTTRHQLSTTSTASAPSAQSLLESTDAEARRHAAFQLYRMMPEDPEEGAEFWAGRLGPWIDAAWPKDMAPREEGSSAALALAAVLSGDAFPEALGLIDALLVPCDRQLRLLDELAGTHLLDKFPDEVLRLLDTVVSRPVPYWDASELRRVLERLTTADQRLAEDHRYRALDAELRRQGI